MCLIHDLGETFTGDIPSFEKTDQNVQTEDAQFLTWANTFPTPQRRNGSLSWTKWKNYKPKKREPYKALDKLEALISHNESDLSTWLPLEYDLQLTYGQENVQFSPYLTALRKCIDQWTPRQNNP